MRTAPEPAFCVDQHEHIRAVRCALARVMLRRSMFSSARQSGLVHRTPGLDVAPPDAPARPNEANPRPASSIGSAARSHLPGRQERPFWQPPQRTASGQFDGVQLEAAREDGRPRYSVSRLPFFPPRVAKAVACPRKVRKQEPCIAGPCLYAAGSSASGPNRYPTGGRR